jgi:DDE superfamily endonuclease
MIRDLMIGGASVEDTLTLWASSLRDAKQRIRPLFTQERVAASAEQFLDGLLGNEPRKTGWVRAEAAGDPGPWRQQAIPGRGQWDADALRDTVCEYALETLGDEDAVLVIDETGFLKQGRPRAGLHASTQAQQARSPIARSECSPPMCRGMAMPSSTGRGAIADDALTGIARAIGRLR